MNSSMELCIIRISVKENVSSYEERDNYSDREQKFKPTFKYFNYSIIRVFNKIYFINIFTIL